ncbi:MAG: tRNA-dihydrouridine synthase family protein [Myxococcales bacterium]|nr:tRNA-dihydrouridine synthase family protein [Myxococcales bacterium]
MSAPSRFPFAPATLLAPMEGVTHPTFRRLIAAHGGLGLLCTEFVRISRAPVSPAFLRSSVVKVPGLPLSVQVMGNDADKMAEAAQLVAEAGADVVDVNLGCPMPRVVKKGVGAAMLKDPALLADVLGAMRERTPGLFSAKIRAGFDTADEVVSIAKVVEDSGVDFLSVHPRRRCDLYEGVADWRIVRVLRRELRVPVVGNGDVWYAQDALRMRAETDCDAVMIGRPAMRNPWIFRQIAELEAGTTPFSPNGDDVLAWMVTMRDALTAERGSVTGKLKELVSWLGRAKDDGGEWKKATLRAATVDDMLRITEAHVGGLPAEALDLQADGHLGLERSGSALDSAHAA